MDNPLTRWKRPIFKIRYSRNSQISVWKPNIFPRQDIPKCFLFYGLGTHGILHTQFGLILTTLWPDEKDLFLKFVILEIRKFLYENLTFFLHKLYQKLFRFYALATQGILHNDFGSIWTTPWSDEIDLFLKFIIREIRKFPYEKLTFFLDKLYQNSFFSVFYFRYPWYTPKPVWFDFDNSLTRWKRLIFKIRYSRNSHISVWKSNFFPRQAIPKFFLFYTLGTHGILHTQFGSIWTTPWSDEIDLFLKFIIREIRKFPYEKLTFFLDKLYQNSFFSVFYFRYPWYTPKPVWFDFDNSLIRWNRPIFKIHYPRNSQISVWKANFFPRQAISKLFLFCFLL